MVRIIIILLTLATAAAHFSFFAGNPNGGELIYALNALGYLTLLALLYAPGERLDNLRNLIRYTFMAYTAITILAYIIFGLTTGDWTVPLGPITKLIEVTLIGSLWWDARRSTSHPNGVSHV